MQSSWLIIVAVLLPISTLGLQCYSDTKLISGQTIGTKAKTCAAGQSCFFGTVDGISPLIKLKHSGCSKLRCKVIGKNKCGSIGFGNLKVKGCCCNTGDFCEVPSEERGILDKIKDFWGTTGIKE